MPKSNSSRLMIEGYKTHVGDGTYNVTLDIPEGYRPVSWDLILEEWGPEYLSIGKVFTYYDAAVGRHVNWQFGYTISGVGSASCGVVVRIVVERSDEVDARIVLGSL